MVSWRAGLLPGWMWVLATLRAASMDLPVVATRGPAVVRTASPPVGDRVEVRLDQQVASAPSRDDELPISSLEAMTLWAVTTWTQIDELSVAALSLNLRDGLGPGALSRTAAHHLSPMLVCTADERCIQETVRDCGGTHASRNPGHKGTSLPQLRAPRHRRMRRTLESAMKGRQADATRF
jgi:hypothetical protein